MRARLQASPVSPMKKTCYKCGQAKPIECFGRDKSRKDGFKHRCKECEANYYLANRDRLLKQQKEYQDKNKERIADRNKRYNLANKEKVDKRRKAYRESNRDELRKKNKEYRSRNRDRIRKSGREYYAANKEKHRKYYNSQWGGLYRLVCVPTGEVYFGSTTKLSHRFSNSYKHLRNKDHPNPRIRELSKSYSPDDFKFEIIIYCDSREEGLLYEQLLIDRFPCCNVRAAQAT